MPDTDPDTDAPRLDAIRLRERAATPPPWTTMPCGPIEKQWAKVYGPKMKQCVADMWGADANANGAFTAHARADVRFLLDQFSCERFGKISLIEWLEALAQERLGTEEAVNLLRCVAWLQKARDAGVEPDSIPFGNIFRAEPDPAALADAEQQLKRHAAPQGAEAAGAGGSDV